MVGKRRHANPLPARMYSCNGRADYQRYIKGNAQHSKQGLLKMIFNWIWG